ncbi:MAG: zinc ribbon domain-containing protein [Clostridia bacterium]|nr:zinc ribbon domain-containing protein [Clostridia bacterium]
MFCSNCGGEVKDGVNFCPFCGTALEKEAVKKSANITTTPESNPKIDALASSILTFGILSGAFSLTVWVSFLGIIFAAIAFSKSKQYISLVGDINGKAAVGRAIARAGLIVGIVYTCIAVAVVVLYVLYFVLIMGFAVGGTLFENVMMI